MKEKFTNLNMCSNNPMFVGPMHKTHTNFNIVHRKAIY